MGKSSANAVAACLLALHCAAGGWASGLPLPRPFGPSSPGLPPPRIPFRSLGYAQGLQNSSVRSLAQGAEGALWIGTENGLFRYDGSGVERFDLFNGLPGLFIRALKTGSDGTLWIGTDQGLAFQHRGRILPAPGAIGQEAVLALACDTQGALWATTAGGLYRGGRTRAFARIQGLPGHPSNGALIASRRGLWVGLDRGVLQRLADGTARTWGSAEGLPGTVYALAEDPQGRIWVHTGDRIRVLHPGRTRFEVLPWRLGPAILSGYALFVDRQGRLWVGSQGRLDVCEGGRWSTLSAAQGLPTAQIVCLCEDAEGALWIGGHGLHQMPGGERWTYYDHRDGLPSDTVWCLRRDRRGTLWAGTMAGAARATPSGWKPLPGTENHCITTAAELPDGRIVASGHPMVLHLWESGGSRAIRYPLPLPPGDTCVGLVVDPRGRPWLCSRNAGVFIATRTAGGWRMESAGVPADTYDSLARDTRGGIWVSGLHGLYHFDGRAWARYTTQDGLLAGVFSVRALLDGEVLVGYRNDLGWARLRRGARGLEILEQHHGYERGHEDLVYLAGWDALGRLWLGGAEGIERIEKGVSHYIGAGDGLVHEDLNDNAFWADPDGTVWIGTSAGGVARYRPGPEGEALAPPARIWHAQMGDTSLDPWSGGEIAVPWKDNRLRVDFSGISFRSSRQLEVETRLAGLEHFLLRTPDRTLRFSNLAPGHYRFEIRARFRGGPWGPMTTLAFRVFPPWWRSWPAFTAYAGALVLGVWGFIRLRTARLARHNRLLRTHVDEATEAIRGHERQLEAQAQALMDLNAQKTRFMGIVAHDLRAPLTRIALSAELLEDEQDLAEVERSAGDIRRESLEMSALVSRFLDITALEDGKARPEPVPMPVAELVAEVAAHYRRRATEKRIAIRFALPLDPVWILADRRFVLACLDNLVDNALKFSPPGTTVTMRVEVGDSEAVLSVEDQGPGLGPEDHARVFGRYVTLRARPTGGEKSTGLGLSIVKHMAEALGGRVWVESSPGEGAAFRVAFLLAPEPGTPVQKC